MQLPFEFEWQVELLLEFQYAGVLQQVFEPLPELVLEELYSQKLMTAACCSFCFAR